MARSLEMTKSLAKSLEPAIEDARGLKCPLPALRARRALMRLDAGARLIVLADDPMSAIDIPYLVLELGDEIVETGEDGGVLRFVICRRGGGARSARNDR
jgi:tRNA 2-thiouridine synthesizing protein A